MEQIPVRSDASIKVNILNAVFTLRYALDEDQIKVCDLLRTYNQIMAPILDEPLVTESVPAATGEAIPARKGFGDYIQEEPRKYIGHFDEWINLFVVDWELLDGAKVPKRDPSKKPSAQFRLTEKMAIWTAIIAKVTTLTWGDKEEVKN